MNDQAAEAPQQRFSVGRYRFAQHRSGMWDVSNGTKGCIARNPLSAFLRLRRFEKQPARPE